MKSTPKSTFAALSFAILAAFLFSSFASNGGSSGTGTHTMMYPRAGTIMADQSMPGR